MTTKKTKGTKMRHAPPFAALLTVLVAGGCARQPPERGMLSGIQMHVIMRFAAQVDPQNTYMFLINNYDPTQQDTPGPYPVLETPSLDAVQANAVNGFATAITSNTTGPQINVRQAGFTDFVVYGGIGSRFAGLQNNYGLFHVRENSDASYVGGLNVNNITRAGVPINSVDPQNDGSRDNIIEFTIDLAQLVRDSAGQPVSDAIEARAAVRNIEWLQVNILALNRIPTDLSTYNGRQVDSMGNTLSGGAYLTIQVSNGGVIQTQKIMDRTVVDPKGVILKEEPGDVYPNGSRNDPIDLTSWEIDITDTNNS